MDYSKYITEAKEKNMKIAETKWDSSLGKIIKSIDLKQSA